MVSKSVGRSNIERRNDQHGRPTCAAKIRMPSGVKYGSRPAAASGGSSSSSSSTGEQPAGGIKNMASEEEEGRRLGKQQGQKNSPTTTTTTITNNSAHLRPTLSRQPYRRLLQRCRGFLFDVLVAMAIVGAIKSALAPALAPFHLLSFSALLGSQLYQSFVVTKVAFATLPAAAYTSFQKRIFPVYFHAQSLLLLVTAATFPPHGPASLVQDRRDFIPFAVAAVCAGLNFVVYGPRTRQLMLDRVEQGKLDAKTKSSPGPSPEMALLKKQFSRAHAMCIHLNLVSMAALLYYTWRLASRLQF